MGLRTIRHYRTAPEAVSTAQAASITPDLQRDDVSAEDLPRDQWLVLVDEMIAKGEYRLALRACFLAQLAQLADLGYIVLARFKTNRDYEYELARRAHVVPTLCEGFTVNRRFFETVWYGGATIDINGIRDFQQRLQQGGGGVS